MKNLFKALYAVSFVVIAFFAVTTIKTKDLHENYLLLFVFCLSFVLSLAYLFFKHRKQ